MDSPRMVCSESRARKRPDVAPHREAASDSRYRAQQQRAFRLIKGLAVRHGAQVLAVTVSSRGAVSTVSSPGGMRGLAKAEVLLPLLVANGVLTQAQGQALLAQRQQQQHPIVAAQHQVN
eukprot:m51a1_g7043 hypothetical protein (120) ;mRNA; f:123557-123991